ncbi:hypothetical protein COLO4_06667 [Corchorus olitorius]|uniref:Uncharacterized protein n=1 Tax=Corchorus olitorius TaxID=93759 RepID=A0A1R3KMC0_9ROSI|nr:hypothetical protein COLO4_06667 [Corchorus olitorius]
MQSRPRQEAKTGRSTNPDTAPPLIFTFERCCFFSSQTTAQSHNTPLR